MNIFCWNLKSKIFGKLFKKSLSVSYVPKILSFIVWLWNSVRLILMWEFESSFCFLLLNQPVHQSSSNSLARSRSAQSLKIQDQVLVACSCCQPTQNSFQQYLPFSYKNGKLLICMILCGFVLFQFVSFLTPFYISSFMAFFNSNILRSIEH